MNASLVRPLGYFELGLELGLVCPQDVADWATRRVAALEDPDPDLCDLATADTLGGADLLAKIQALIPAPDWRDALPLLFARIGKDFHCGHLSLEQVTKYMYSATAAAGVLDEDQYYEAYFFDDEYDAAQRGLCGSLDDLAVRVSHYLGGYAKYAQVLDDAA